VGDVNAKDFQSVIQKEYPDLLITSCKLMSGGQFNHIVLLNNDLIFRFPRYPLAVASLAHELRLMAIIRHQITIPVPETIFTSQDFVTPGSVFAGHTLISGEELSIVKYERLTEPVKDKIAAQLAEFTRRLHQISLDEMREKLPAEWVKEDLRMEDKRESWADLYKATTRQLFPEMRPEARRSIANLFETFLDNPAIHSFTPSLRHGDLGPSNILFDPVKQQVSGIIDFNSIAVGDPAVDIAALSLYGEQFIKKLQGFYPEIESLLKRASFIRGTYAIQEALDGLRDGDRGAYQRGMALYI
jgi:aminoglycoside 2''-phosphotransferase